MKEDHQKALKKLTLFFLLNPVPFNGQNYQNQKGPRTSDPLLFRLQNKFRKIPLLVMYYLTEFYDVIYSGFRVILKITLENLCKSIHDIINYSTSINGFVTGIVIKSWHCHKSKCICHFKSGKCGKEG